MTDLNELEKRKDEYIEKINALMQQCLNLKKLDLVLAILKKDF